MNDDDFLIGVVLLAMAICFGIGFTLGIIQPIKSSQRIKPTIMIDYNKTVTDTTYIYKRQ